MLFLCCSNVIVSVSTMRISESLAFVAISYIADTFNGHECTDANFTDFSIIIHVKSILCQASERNRNLAL